MLVKVAGFIAGSHASGRILHMENCNAYARREGCKIDWLERFGCVDALDKGWKSEIIIDIAATLPYLKLGLVGASKRSAKRYFAQTRHTMTEIPFS